MKSGMPICPLLRPNMSCSLIVLFFAFTWSKPVAAATKSTTESLMPPAASGQIDGHQAYLFWPTAGTTPNELIADVTDCVVHVEPSDSDDELLFQCGKWFLPPVGRFRGWVESKDWIANAPTVFSYDGGPFRGAGIRVVIPVVPAAEVRLHYKGKQTPGSTIRFISIPAKGYPFDRDVSVAAAAQGVRLPAGRAAIAGLFNTANDAVALSRPFTVKASGVTDVTLAPEDSASVYAVLVRPYDARGPSEAPATLEIDTPAGKRAPDFLYQSPSRIFASWYGLPSSAMTLRVVSSGMRLNPVAVSLKRGEVATIRRSMQFTANTSSPQKQ